MEGVPAGGERVRNAVAHQSRWMTYAEASRRVGHTVDALHRFAEEGRLRTRTTWLPWPFTRELVLREDVEMIRSTMSGGARDWDSNVK
jgi:hypothetical protein